METKFNICIVSQVGRLELDALLFILSYRMFNLDSQTPVYICTPEFTDNWDANPDIRGGEIAELLQHYGAKIVPFRNVKFGAKYPISNKIYALSALPRDEAFLFLDTDHVVTGSFEAASLNFHRPSGAYEVPRFPRETKFGWSRADVWDALYAKFNISTDQWKRAPRRPDDPNVYPYFNAGSFYYARAGLFYELLRYVAEAIYDDPPDELSGQALFPWLDQISIPLVMCLLGADNHQYRDDHPLSKVAFHYFSKARLCMPRHARVLEVALSAIETSDHRDLFVNADSYYYFFGEGREYISSIIRRDPEHYDRFPNLRNELKKVGKWIK